MEVGTTALFLYRTYLASQKHFMLTFHVAGMRLGAMPSVHLGNCGGPPHRDADSIDLFSAQLLLSFELIIVLLFDFLSFAL